LTKRATTSITTCASSNVLGSSRTSVAEPGTKETYSYYELTDLVHVILTEGLATGVQQLAAEEATISEKYSE